MGPGGNFGFQEGDFGVGNRTGANRILILLGIYKGLRLVRTCKARAIL